MKPKPPTRPTAPSRHTAAERRALALEEQQHPMMAKLRHQAEAQLRQQRRKQKPELNGQKPATDAERALHELQVHQIELEMQNTELQVARDTMEAQLEKYTDLYDFAPVGYFSLDEQGRIQEVNLTGAALLGVERAFSMNGRFSRFVAPASRPDFLAFLKRVFAGTGPEVCDLAMIKEDGTASWARLRGTAALSAREVRRWCRVSVADITALKQSEELLRRSEERFRVATLAVNSLIWTNNPQGMMEGEQPGWAQFTGQTPKEYQGYGWAGAVHPDDAQPTIKAWNAAVAEKRTFDFEHRVRRHDGAWRTCSIRAVPVIGGDGKIREWVGVHHDISERKQVEEALRASEERYRTLFDLGPVAVYSCDVSGVLRDCNRTAVELWGREPKPGDTDQRFCGSCNLYRSDGTFMPHTRTLMAEVLAGKIPEARDLEVQIERPDGSRITVIINIRPLKNERGKITGAINCFVDITARKRTEEALRVSEEKFRGMIESSHDCIKELDLEGRLLSMNRSGQCLLEINDLNSVLHAPWPDFWQGSDSDAARQAVTTARAGGVGAFEGFYVTCQGTPKWWSVVVTPIVDSSGEPARLLAVSRDITERKQSEKKLRESEERFRAMADAIAQLAWQAQPDGSITWYNQRWYDYTGTTPGQMVGWGWQSVHDPKVLPKVLKRWKACIASGQPFEMTFPLRRADGVFRLFLTRSVPQKDQRGRVLQWFGTNTDVDDQKRAEEAQRRVEVLAASNQKLEKEIVWRQAVEKSLVKEKQQQKELQEQARRLAHKLLHAQEEERARISRELHDQIAQTLVGINLRLTALITQAGKQGSGFHEQVTQTQQLVEASVETVHRFARDLRPALLDNVGLIPALNGFVKTFSEQTKLRVRLSFFAGVEKLDNATRTVFYRVAQEALTNVAKHAQATTVVIHIQKLGHQIGMTIQDNGQCPTMDPMDKARRGQRLGLIGMRERLEMVGGTFDIQCVAGQGTTVRAAVPLSMAGGNRKKQPARPRTKITL